MAANEPRVSMLAEAEARAIGKELGIPSTMAGLNVFRVFSRHPELAKVISGQLSMLLFKANKLDLRLRELIIMRIGWRTGAAYEWTQHWHVAKAIGMADEDILAVRDPDNAPNLNDADRAVIAATDEVLDHGAVSAATWAACAEHLPSDEERLELVAAICNWNSFSILLRSLDIPLEDGTDPWPPDGRVGPG